MVKKEVRGIDLAKIILSSVLGLTIYILLLILITVIVKNELMPYNIIKILSKLSLFAACLLGCAHTKKKARGEAFINCIFTCFLIFLMAILTTLLNENTKYDYAGIVISLLLCILGCFLLFIKKRKNSKLHKRRIKR